MNLLNSKYTNKQNLTYTVINKINDYYYDIQFEIDNLILYKKFHNNIKFGDILHPNSELYSEILNNVNKNYCKEVALNYSNKYDFQLNNIQLYYLIGINNWMDEICQHMNNKYIKYDKFKAHQIALKFNNYTDFIKYAYNCYSLSHKNNWLIDICSHMTKKYVKWDFNKCFNEALKYNTRNEFYKNNVNCYSICVKNKWLKEVCKHMEWKSGKKWTKNECIELALKYENVGDFLKEQRNCYQISRKYGWLKEITQHMKPKNQLQFPRIIYAWEFSDNHVYIGLTKNKYKREEMRKKDLNDPINIHIGISLLIPQYKQLTDFIPACEAQIKEQEFIELYKNNNWIILNRIKGGSLGGCLTNDYIKKLRKNRVKIKKIY